MTLEEMQATQKRVADALGEAGFSNVEALPFEPGDAPEVAFYTDTEHEGPFPLVARLEPV